MFGLITTKRRGQILKSSSATYEMALGAEVSASRTKGRLAAEALAERDAALAELAALKASRARSNANLRPGNVRRKQDAQTT